MFPTSLVLTAITDTVESVDVKFDYREQTDSAKEVCHEAQTFNEQWCPPHPSEQLRSVMEQNPALGVKMI